MPFKPVMVVIITHRISRKGYNRSGSIHIYKVPHWLVEYLFRTVRARKMAVALGFEKILLKDNQLKCHFVAKSRIALFPEQNL